MSQDIADMPGIGAAMERFDVMAGKDASAANGVPADAKTESRPEATATTRETTQADAPPTATEQAQTSVTTPTDTPAATDAPGNGKSTNRNDKGRFAKADPEPTPSGDTDGKSKFTKARERLDKTWDAVNKRKGDLDAQAASLEQQRLTLERDKAQLEAIRRQAEQPQATPEQALQAAQMRRRDADALRMQARRAEDAGEMDKAEKLTKQANKADAIADDMESFAEQLRRNPPVSMQQRQQQFEQARKQWTIEACNAFPDLGKNGSRLQQVVAQHLNAIAKQDPQLLVHPSLIYHATRLADAQIKAADLQAVAARVPVLEKETEQLRARIKALESQTSPAGDAGVNRIGVEPKDDYASLRRDAADLGQWR